jgi:hypothetical protein
MRYINSVIALTLLLFVGFYFYKWYMLVYKTTRCFGNHITKPLEAIYYEEIFIKLLQFLICSTLVLGSYYLIKKIRKIRTHSEM